MNSEDITLTNARLEKALNLPVNNIISQTVPEQINQAIGDVKLRAGSITKFYPWLDKAEVQLYNGEKVLCKIGHRFGGDICDYYTPDGDEDYCDELHEPCIRPLFYLECLVADIHEDDSNEQVLLFYFLGDDDVVSPAKKGNMKISLPGASNEYYIEFGNNGLNIFLGKDKTVNQKYGALDDVTEVDYANSDDVYTKMEVYNKTEVYTKEEVDELITQKIAEALNEGE